MRWTLTALTALSLLSTALAFDVQGRITFSTPNTSIPLGSKVSLDYGAKSTIVRYDGSFTIYDVADGEHTLEPIVPGFALPLYHLVITSPSVHIQALHPIRQPISLDAVASLPHPLRIVASNKEDYYTAAQGVNLLGMLKNPMILMMLFTGVALFAMPKLMAGLDMDPEMAKDVAETRQKMQGMQNMDFMGSLSSILAGSTEETAPSQPQPQASAKKRRGK